LRRERKALSHSALLCTSAGWASLGAAIAKRDHSKHRAAFTVPVPPPVPARRPGRAEGRDLPHGFPSPGGRLRFSSDWGCHEFQRESRTSLTTIRKPTLNTFCQGA
jgi:hypothetical protein